MDVCKPLIMGTMCTSAEVVLYSWLQQSKAGRCRLTPSNPR